jgi:hypothetical protein
MQRFAIAAAVGATLLSASGVAFAGPNDAILLPTAIPDKAELALHPESVEQLGKLARQIDAILSEAVQDLGLTLTVSDRSRDLPTDDALVERAHDSWCTAWSLTRGARLSVPRPSQCSTRTRRAHKVARY